MTDDLGKSFRVNGVSGIEPSSSSTSSTTTVPGVPGKRTLTEPLTGGTLPRNTRELVSHDPPQRAYRRPEDEQPRDWHALVQAHPPQDPFLVRNVVPRRESCPRPPHAQVERPLSHHGGDGPSMNGWSASVPDIPSPALPGSFPRIRPQNLPPSPAVMLPTHLQQRDEQWEAYLAIARQVQAQQESVAPHIDAFRHASRDPELASLGILVPRGFAGTLGGLIGRQEVPHRGGLSVDSLFRSDNSLQLTSADESAIASVGGGADGVFLGTLAADRKVQACLGRVKAAAETVRASGAELAAAEFAIKRAEAKSEIASAQAELEELKGGVEGLKAILEFVGPGKIVELATKGLESLSQVGEAASLVLGAFPVPGVAAAEARLAAAQRAYVDAGTQMLAQRLEAAKATSLAAVHELQARKDELARAVTLRRLAYDAAGQQAGGGHPKVAALIAAIPLVEKVVASLHLIVDLTRDANPPYNDAAGMGYGIALGHKLEEAADLPLVIGTLECCHDYYGAELADWKARLTALTQVRDRMTGDRPGALGAAS